MRRLLCSLVLGLCGPAYAGGQGVPPAPWHVTVTELPDTLASCDLPPAGTLPAWATRPSGVHAVIDEPHARTVFTAARFVPAGVSCARDFRLLRLEPPVGPQAGVLAALVQPLAREKIGVEALSTRQTLYLIIHAPDLVRAEAALRAAGHEVRR